MVHGSRAGGLRRAQRPRDATGRDAARNRGLRAPSRCTTEPRGLRCRTDSNSERMRVGAQVTQPPGSAAPALLALGSCGAACPSGGIMPRADIGRNGLARATTALFCRSLFLPLRLATRIEGALHPIDLGALLIVIPYRGDVF